MPEHTITIDAYNVSSPTDEQLADLLDALIARAALIGPAVSADDRSGAIGMTVTVEAATADEAHQAAVKALGEELVAAGLVEGWQRVDPGRAAIFAVS